MQKGVTDPAKASINCQRCRKRRFPCDRRMPACSTCLAAGESCPGYNRPLRWSQKHEVLKRRKITTSARGACDAVSDERGNNSSRHEVRIPNEMPPMHVEAPGLPMNIDSDPHFEPSPPLPDWMQIPMPDLDELVLQQASVDDGSLPFLPMYASGPFTTWPAHANFEQATASPLTRRDLSLGAENSTPLAGKGKSSRQKILRSPIQKPPDGTAGSLLHTFYRLSQPKTVSGFAEDDFVNYYFKNVARLFSCFDADSNPFRTMVVETWRSNRTISLAVQSMAIAHLSNWYPYMAALGLGKRKQAWRLLQHDLKRTGSGESHSSDNEMLSLLLLGLSSSWHINSNLGLQFLTIARNLIKYRLQFSTGKISAYQGFFEEALIYWEMLTSFVDPVPMTCFPGHGMPELQTVPLPVPKQPHPWTGISAELHYAFAEIGRLLRRQKSTSGHLDVTDPLEVQFAENLDEYLTSLQLPAENEIEDFDDSTTSKQDLIQSALVYRNISLMELFGIFPGLLETRLNTGSESQGLACPITGELSSNTEQRREEWFLAVAFQSLELLQQISIASAACRLQPLLLVSIAGQMRPAKDDGEPSQDSEEVLDDDCDSPRNVDHSRWFIEARMLALSKKFPQKPFLRMIDIMKEVWNRLDSGVDAHWMDVVNDKGWYTIMG